MCNFGGITCILKSIRRYTNLQRKLEGLSFSAVFLSMLGKKEDRLDKEKEEFLAAELRYEESLESIKELQKEIKEIDNKLINFTVESRTT